MALEFTRNEARLEADPTSSAETLFLPLQGAVVYLIIGLREEYSTSMLPSEPIQPYHFSLCGQHKATTAAWCKSLYSPFPCLVPLLIFSRCTKQASLILKSGRGRARPMLITEEGRLERPHSPFDPNQIMEERKLLKGNNQRPRRVHKPSDQHVN